MNELCNSLNCTEEAEHLIIVTCHETNAHFVVNVCLECYKNHQAAVLDKITKKELSQ